MQTAGPSPWGPFFPSPVSAPLCHSQRVPPKRLNSDPADPRCLVPETVRVFFLFFFFPNLFQLGMMGYVILALGSRSQEDQEFKIIFGSARLCLE